MWLSKSPPVILLCDWRGVNQELEISLNEGTLTPRQDQQITHELADSTGFQANCLDGFPWHFVQRMNSRLDDPWTFPLLPQAGFVFSWNISTTIRWIVIICGTDIYGVQMILPSMHTLCVSISIIVFQTVHFYNLHAELIIDQSLNSLDLLTDGH